MEQSYETCFGKKQTVEDLEDKDEGEERVLLIQEKEGQGISSFMEEMEGGGKEEVKVKEVSVENYVEEEGGEFSEVSEEEVEGEEEEIGEGFVGGEYLQMEEEENE